MSIHTVAALMFALLPFLGACTGSQKTQDGTLASPQTSDGSGKKPDGSGGATNSSGTAKPDNEAVTPPNQVAGGAANENDRICRVACAIGDEDLRKVPGLSSYSCELVIKGAKDNLSKTCDNFPLNLPALSVAKVDAAELGFAIKVTSQNNEVNARDVEYIVSYTLDGKPLKADVQPVIEY